MTAAPKRRTAPLWAALVAAALAAAAWRWFRGPRSSVVEPVLPGTAMSKTAPVRAYRLRRRPLHGVIFRNGTVRAREETNLQFGAAGRVVRFDAEKGRFLRNGDVVAQLDAGEADAALQTAQLEFQRAAEKYFQDRTIDRLDYEKAKLRYTQARLASEKTTLRAPHAGYLVEKWVLPGEQVEPGTVIGKLMDKSRVDVELSLAENDIGALRVGQEVEVTVDALPDLRLRGRVASVTPYLQGTARSFSVKVPLKENPREALAPGMFARCVIHRYEKADALTVPAEAGVASDESRVTVFVVDEANRVRARRVPVLFNAGRELEVGDLAEGDTVVLDPSPALVDGATVTVTGLYDPATDAPATAAPLTAR